MKKSIIGALVLLSVSSAASANSTYNIDPVSYERDRKVAVASVNSVIKKAGGLDRLKSDAKNHNDADSNYALGQMYRFGIVVKQDSQLAIKHLRLSSEKNNAEATFILAKMLANKDETSPDLDVEAQDKGLAYELTKKSAELGIVDAQYHLGLYYINGEHFQEDRDLGLFWLSRASDAGHEQAKLSRMKFLYSNHELKVSYDSVRLRASEGHLPSMIMLSNFYANGWVVQRNESKAYRLLNAAASLGSKEAIDLLKTSRRE
jgi:hypothetical protein